MAVAEGRGPDIPSAIDSAVAQLGASRQEVRIRVISSGRPDGEAVVTATMLASQPDPELAEKACTLVNQLITLMGLTGRATVMASTDPISLQISGRDMGLLIGWRGGHLRAVQTVVGAMLHRELGAERRLVIDIEGYRSRREAKARELALRAARQVRASGDPIQLDPMSAFERRVVHLALEEDDAVVTVSVGQEPDRHVVVEPRVRG